MGNHKDRALIEYLPTVLKDVREFQAIMKAEQPDIYELFDEIQAALDNLFWDTLNEYGVKRWEKILNIVPKATFTLEERRINIIILLLKQLPYTMRMLEQILSDLCGAGNFDIFLNSDEYELKIRLELFSSNNAEIVGLMLKQMCPANLICIVSNDTVSQVALHIVGITLQSKTYTSTVVCGLTDYYEYTESETINTPMNNVITQRIEQNITISI